MDKAERIESLVEKMITDFEETTSDDKIYRRDIQDLGRISIQWNFAGVSAFQILELDNYTYGMGEDLEHPDVTFTWPEPDNAIRFLQGDHFKGFSSGWHGDRKGNFTYRYNTERDPETGKTTRLDAMRVTVSRGYDFHPYIIHKLPMFRHATRITLGDQPEYKEEFGAYIPINETLDPIEQEILPKKVFEHFFSKASNIFLLNDCPCRAYDGCTEHDISIGCMHLGDDTLKIIGKESRGRFVTKEEALDVLNRAVDDGLIPLLGRSKDEALGFGFHDTGHFMSMCFCCECCCVNAKAITYGSSGSKINYIFNRMEGVTVEVDEETCNGCEMCIEACTWSSLSMVDTRARIDQDRCLGCGRCEEECPVEAISITIDDDSRVHQLIRKLESYVDVTPQPA
jgi:UDP-glucose 4-epimerase